jgi:hypothetical protein
LLTASVRTVSVSDQCPVSLPTWAQLSSLAAVALLSPALAFLGAIAVEIVIGVLVDAGGLAFPALVAAGAIGWLLLRRLRRRQGGAAVEV